MTQNMLTEYKKQLKEKGEIHFKIKGRPGASKTIVKDIMSDGTIKIDIAKSPEKGKANEALVAFLAKEFDVLRKSVKIISGASSKVKLVKIVK